MANSRLGGVAVRVGLLAALGAGAGCYGNTTTMFPAGLEPWETPNMATLPAGTPANMFPEEITFTRLMFQSTAANRSVPSVHARAYIQAPIAAVWAAARDPQTGRDPTASNGFSVLAYANDATYPFSFRTHVIVNSIATLEWDVEWRHGVVQGTDAAPLVTATRWQKTSGSDALTVLEGSLVLRAVAGQPAVTEVQYQYHLLAAFSGHSTIEGYLGVIYGRLRDRAHGTPLEPNDCTGCPAPPPGY